jgi:hypothetical protein
LTGSGKSAAAAEPDNAITPAAATIPTKSTDSIAFDIGLSPSLIGLREAVEAAQHKPN